MYSKDAPAKDMVADSLEDTVAIFESKEGVTGAWIKADASDLVGVEQ